MLGKVMLGAAWVFTILSGQQISYVLSGIASILAAIYWVVKIKKELKKDNHVGKNGQSIDS